MLTSHSVEVRIVSDGRNPLISHPLEPAILVMHHSMKPHPAITATLLDFMCRVRTPAFPPFLGGQLAISPKSLSD